MRLGAQEVRLAPGTRARELYGRDVIAERHRHRFEFNNRYLEHYRAGGPGASPASRADGLVEIIELPAHPWFVATQFHPEFTSTPRDGHPLFTGFVRAARACRARAAARGGGRMKLVRLRGRRRPAAVPDRRALRHRIGGAGAGSRRAAVEITTRARHAVHLQGLLRQGQPLLAPELPRPGAGAGPEDPRGRARASSACRC